MFFLSLVGQLIISSLLYFGVRAPGGLDFLRFQQLKLSYSQLVSPQSHQDPIIKSKPDIFLKITPKLEETKNQFNLKHDRSLIKSAYAASDYGPSNGFISVDLDDGTILLEKNPDQRFPIASLTKVMTAIVALDLASPNDQMTVSRQATLIEPSKLNLRTGEKYSLEQLLNGLLITSANDCAEVIKGNIDQIYGEEVFVKAMNEKAKIIGLKNTHFTNPQGFDDQDHFSSASDLATLSAYALNNYPLIAQIVSKQSEDMSPPTGFDKRLYLNNWNGLLGLYPGTYGVKIGNTQDAGKTTIVASKRGSKNVLAVFLGAQDLYGRDLGAATLLDDSFSKFGLTPVSITRAQLKEKYQGWKFFD